MCSSNEIGHTDKQTDLCYKAPAKEISEFSPYFNLDLIWYSGNVKN